MHAARHTDLILPSFLRSSLKSHPCTKEQAQLCETWGLTPETIFWGVIRLVWYRLTDDLKIGAASISKVHEHNTRIARK